MARFSNIVNSFIGGEISPQHQGRTDIQELYRNGCARLENFVPSAAGGVVKRSGTVFERDVTTAGNPNISANKLICFKGNAVFPDVIFGLPSVPETVGAIAGPAKPAILEHPFNNAAVVGYASGSATVSSFNLLHVLNSLYSSIYTAATDPSSSNVEEGFLSQTFVFYVGSGETANQAQHIQVGDTLIIVHGNNPPIFLKRASSTSFISYSSWGIAAVPDDFLNSDGAAYTNELMAKWILGTPFRDIVYDKTNQPVMSVSGTLTIGGTITVTITNASAWGGFSSGHIGALFMSTPVASETGVVVITAVTNSTTATGIVIREFGGTGSTADWREASWSNARGWPRTVTFFRGRVLYGGNLSEPDRVWASQIFDIGQMSPRTLFLNSAGSNGAAASTDPFQSSILSTQIQWMANNDNNIFIGSADREYIAQIEVSSSTSSLSVSAQTNYGSAYVQAVPTNNTIVFVGRDGYTLREMAFNFNDDNFVAENISRYADHLINEAGVSKADLSTAPASISNIELQAYPEVRVFCRTDEGGLYSVTRDRQLGVFAWNRFSFNGTEDVDLNASNKVGTFCLSGSSVYIKVQREIDSTTKQYIEYFKVEPYRLPIVFSQQNYFDMFYLDMWKFFVVPGSATLTGLTHLEGQTVRCLGSVADSGNLKDYGTFVVNGSGEITTPVVLAYAFVGVDFNANIITLPLEAGSRYGNAQGEIKRIEEVILRFYKSVGCSIAPAEYALEDYTNATAHTASIYTLQPTRAFQALPFVPPNIELNKMLPLYTGDISVKLDSSYDTRGQIYIRSSSPYPCVISSIVMKGVTYDD